HGGVPVNPKKIVLFALVCAVVAVPMFAASYVVPADDVFVAKSDAVVLARAIGTYARASASGDIETVTRFSLTETEKGFVSPNFEVRTPGGILADRVKLVPGAPSFEAGTDYLLFLRHLPEGGFATTDFGLGVFAFGDDFGRRTVRRSTEIYGWDLDGGTHREFQRDAGAFIRYIRSVAAGSSPAPDYMTSVPASSAGSMHPAAAMVTTLSSFTGTSYTISCGGGGEGCTWAAFPVSFNQGNTEPGAPGPVGQEGKSGITSACAAWSGTGVGISYSLATFTANSNGILDATDHVNNVVFEKSLAAAGAPAYNCATGGTLGIGGINSASGTHLHNGETYITTSEVDVSMNQGIANCTSLFNSGDFTTAITHEIGHTLGFRHSDQTRVDNPSTPCSSDPSLDCSNSAVMRSSIPHNLSGALQTYDISAAQTVYGTGPACTPAAIGTQPTGSTINQGSQATLSVTATGTSPFTYQWYAGNSGDTSSPVGGGTTASIQVSPSSTTSYWVKVTNSCNATGANSNAATVTVTTCTPAAIGTQPTGSTITQGSQATLSVSATGTAPFTYQWYVGTSGETSSPVGGGTTASIQVSPSSTTPYWVKVTNSCNTTGANSNTATVTVSSSCTAPQITTQPAGSAITFGSSAQLSVAATGTSLSYQWYTSPKGNTSSPLFNANTATINVNPQGTTTYWVRVTNTCGTADSNTATVTVNCLAPSPTVTPGSRTITQGSSTIFSVIASGGPNMTFQWYQGIAPDTSNPLAGQTGTSLTVSPSAATSYWVQATVPGCGTANSNTASVTVNPNNGCAPVTIATPTAVQNGASYTLTTSASSTAGGITITWYQQTDSGQIAVGTGASISVSPTVTTTYLAQAQNSCGSTNSATVTVTIGAGPCTAPNVIQPSDQTIGLGSSTTITVTASGAGTLHYQWYRGAAGDTSVPVGTDSATLITGPLTANGTFWVKVTNDCSSSTSSVTITVSVEPARHRSVHH
ncbi:MAG TPA: hypothetical protein VH087_18185, partial [Thermoanaerobaculia bacterium]|nr:hypothetical protein [Thermoanaerobaculia bacterium]